MTGRRKPKMSGKETMVKQWSFCPLCKGVGCSECNRGTVAKEISLSSLTRLVMYEYSRVNSSNTFELEGDNNE